MLVDVGKINWKLLRKQKQTLLKVIGKETPESGADLTGILNVIDKIQDEGAKKLTEKTVFGKSF